MFLAEKDSKVLNKSCIFSVNWERAAVLFFYSTSLSLLMGFKYLTLVKKQNHKEVKIYFKQFSHPLNNKTTIQWLENNLQIIIRTPDEPKFI